MDRPNCEAKEPLIKLGAGGAPELDYSLPQSSCFTLYGSIPVAIDSGWWSAEAKKPPAKTMWDELKVVRVPVDKSGMWVDLAKATMAHQPLSVGAGATRSANRAPTDAQVAEVAKALEGGLQPVAVRNLWGKTEYRYVAEPSQATPMLTVLEEYEVCSYLGNYGAGRTVKTFSLLPGEKTTISIRTYTESTDSLSRAESILDSFTEESSSDFETTLQNEQGNTETKTNSQSFNGSLTVGVTIPAGDVPVDVSGTAGGGVGHSTVREKYTKTIESAVQKQVASAAAKREIQINTTSTSSTTSGTDQTIQRQLANINLSRVLNFVFRQLAQQYIVVVYLKNVRVLYSNGYPEARRLIDLPDLQSFLEQALAPGKAEAVLEKILRPYCSVLNYRGEAKRFIEKVTVDLGDCPFPTAPASESYFRRAHDLDDSYDNIHVPGVILSVTQHVLPTDSVIAESLLGQGEALDCYNQSLQYAAVQKAELENKLASDALDALRAVPDPVARAAAYAAQTHGCCDDDSDETSTSSSTS